MKFLHFSFGAPMLLPALLTTAGCGSGGNDSGSVIGSRAITIVDVGAAVTPANGSPAFAASIATSINDAGQIVGYAQAVSTIFASTRRVPFLWQNGKSALLASPDDADSVPAAINNQGLIAGYTQPLAAAYTGGLGGNGAGSGTGGFPTPSDPIAQNGAFLYDKQGLHKLLPVTTYQSQATGLNARGQVVGNVVDTFNLSNTPPRVFVHDDSGVQLLDEPPGYTASYASGINSRGLIAGYATTGTPRFTGGLSALNGGRLARGRAGSAPLPFSLLTEGQAFVYSKGVFTPLPALGGASKANAINDIGQIVGEANTAGGQTHAVLWQNGSVTDLGTLGVGGYANAINAGGDVVGTSYTIGSLGVNVVSTVAFIVHKGVMTDLNTLLPANSGWILMEATGINAKGQIVGSGRHNGQGRAFLLTPQ